jgi:hypothetical protein
MPRLMAGELVVALFLVLANGSFVAVEPYPHLSGL